MVRYAPLTHPTFALYLIHIPWHSQLATYHSVLATQHSQLATYHSVLATQHSQLTTYHSALATQHSQLTTYHSALATQHSGLSTHYIEKPPIPGGFKVSRDNLLNYTVITAIAPPNAEKTAETDAVANSHHAAVAAALRVSSACRCA